MVGRDAPILLVGGSEDHARRALFTTRKSASRDGPPAGYIWPARSRGHRHWRQGGHDLRPHHAALADASGAERQQPILGRPHDRAAVPPLEGYGGSADG